MTLQYALKTFPVMCPLPFRAPYPLLLRFMIDHPVFQGDIHHPETRCQEFVICRVLIIITTSHLTVLGAMKSYCTMYNVHNAHLFINDTFEFVNTKDRHELVIKTVEQNFYQDESQFE